MMHSLLHGTTARHASCTLVALTGLLLLLLAVGIVEGHATVTRPAPDFKAQAVVNGEFQELSLSDFAGKYLVLFFYPLDFTFVCPTEIIAFSDAVEQFREVNADIAGVSVDSHFVHLKWIQTARNEGGLGGVDITLISDITHQIAKDYGVYIEELGHAVRGLFIIDTNGIVRQITVNDLSVGRNVDEALRLVKAFQYADEHGEVCPANWKPGSASMKPNPWDSKEYFSSHYQQHQEL